MRLNKFLSGAGVASRRKCDEIIAAGRVCVNGKICSELGVNVDEKRDIVMVDGQRVAIPENFVYLKLNKPKGYACTASDEHGRKTIFDLVQSDVRLFSVGRLDFNTEGLIFLTNDGDFANRVAHPRFHFDKEYYVTIEGEVKESELAVLRAGVVENGLRMPKAKVQVLEVEEKEDHSKSDPNAKPVKILTRLSVIIDEGQNHQVRRMFEAIGKTIVLLKRVRIGQVKLGDLQRGKTKPLTTEEISFFSY